VLLTWFVWAQIQKITTDNHLLLDSCGHRFKK
jgi:hypothetical protein